MPRPKPARKLISEQNVAERVAYEREQRGWSYAGLAQRLTAVGCAIDPSALYKIEKADPPRRITVDELVGLSEVFGLTLTELVTPLDVIVSEQTLKLIGACRSAHEQMGDAFDDLAAHVAAHPKAGEVFESEWSEWDAWAYGRVMVDRVHAASEKILSAFEAKHGRKATRNDMRTAKAKVDRKSAPAKRSSRGEHR